MRFRETAKIQTVISGGKISFQRSTGYRIVLKNGTVKNFKPRELKAMSEVDFITNVLELDPSTVKILETEDRRTPPRFAPKSPERIAEMKARQDRVRARKTRKKVILTPASTNPDEDAVEANTRRIVAEMAAEMGVRLIEPPAIDKTV